METHIMEKKYGFQCFSTKINLSLNFHECFKIPRMLKQGICPSSGNLTESSDMDMGNLLGVHGQ